MQTADITTDYLVIGAGLSGLSFVDELLTRTTDKTFTVIDKRAVAGGHWNDSYPFVHLHQPSELYGVESKELGSYRVEEDGPNKGYLRLASGTEVTTYCHDVMNNRFLQSGRVTFLPQTEYLSSDGTLRDTRSGRIQTVCVRERLVDAAWYTNDIPATHVRSYTVDSSVTCIAPNDLPEKAAEFKHFSVLGGGKTGIDTVLFLLGQGTDPDGIQWIIPNDYWYLNRGQFQPIMSHFKEVFGSMAESLENAAQARDAEDLALRYEQQRRWFRLDPNIIPQQYHAATISHLELDQLRRIKNIVRSGYVRSITSDKVILSGGTISTTRPSTIYIDCTASAVAKKPIKPIWESNKITLQLVRYPLVCTSAAMIALLESESLLDDARRNTLMKPMSFGKTLDDYIESLIVDTGNRGRLRDHAPLAAWVKEARTDGFAKLLMQVDSKRDIEKLMILERMRKAAPGALINLVRLRARGGRSRL